MRKQMMFDIEESEHTVLTRMNQLRGLFAILIVLGHCGRRFAEEQIALVIPHYGAFIWVCFFFTVSGWSMAYNYDNRKNYLHRFGQRKIFRLLCLVAENEILANLINIFVFHSTIKNVSQLLLEVNWYVYEMIALYLVFWLVYGLLGQNEKKRNIVIGILTSLIALVTWCFYREGLWEGWTYAYYFSTLSFALGIYIHSVFPRMLSARKKVFLWATGGMIIGCSCLYLPKESFVGGVLLHNLLGICAMVALVLILTRIRIRSKIIDFLTRYAAYIYLYQFCVMVWMEKIYRALNRDIDYLYVLCVVVMTISIAYIVDCINKVIKSHLRSI